MAGRGGSRGNWNALPAGTSYPTIAVVDSGHHPQPVGIRRPRDQERRTWSRRPRPRGPTGTARWSAASRRASEDGYTGAEPHANIVSIKVLDGSGLGSKSDVIAACDWILQNKATYNIRVANFSINGW